MADKTIITPTVARRNGLDYFELILDSWGERVVQGLQGGFQEYKLPPNVSLAGVSIAPTSTVSEVLVDGTPQSYIGVQADMPPNDLLNPFNAAASVGHPFEGTIAGPITIRATKPTLWSGTSSQLGIGMILEDKGFPKAMNARDASQVADFGMERPVLALNCWLRPGASRTALRRHPYNRFWRVEASKFPGAGVTEYVSWPVLGRRQVVMEAWCLPTESPNAPPITTGVFEVKLGLLRTPSNERLSGSIPFPATNDQTGNLFEVGGTRGTLRVGSQRNYLHAKFEDPTAMLAVASITLLEGNSSIVVSLRAKD